MAYTPSFQESATGAVITRAVTAQGNANLSKGLKLPAATKVFADSPYAATPNDFFLRIDAVGGNVQIDLPDLNSNRGMVICIKKIDASANTLTVQAAGGDTIDGVGNRITAIQYVAFWLIAPDVGTDWAIMA